MHQVFVFSINKNWFIILKNCFHYAFWGEKVISHLKAVYSLHALERAEGQHLFCTAPGTSVDVLDLFPQSPTLNCGIPHIPPGAQDTWQALATLGLWRVEQKDGLQTEEPQLTPSLTAGAGRTGATGATRTQTTRLRAGTECKSTGGSVLHWDLGVALTHEHG